MPPAAMQLDDASSAADFAEAEPVLTQDDVEDDEGDVMVETLDEEEEEEEEETVKMPGSSRKRETPLSNDDEDDEEEFEETPTKRRKKNTKQEEKENNGRRGKRKAGGKPLSDATASPSINAALGSHRNVNEVGKPAEAGIIQKIYVENFMCHKKMSADLCRNVNFIYGQNGSGKSAILAAIQICLGAGARRTNRARNLKELVRKDTTASCARIRVTLLNKGDDAYEHDKYGDSITVERTIALRGGFNGYKLYDVHGNEKSRNKKDLDELLDKLNIQVENPVAILDQEESKRFLTGKAVDKYRFFMKATELERIDVSYRNAVEQVAEMETQASRLEDALAADKELVEKCKAEVKKHQELGKLESKKRKCETTLAWALYKEKLHEMTVAKEKMELFKVKAEKKREELTQAEAASQEGNEGEKERRNHLDELSKEAEESSERKKTLEQDLKKANEPFKSLQRQLKQLKTDEKEADKDLLSANKALQKKRDEIAASAGSAEAEQARRNTALREAEERRDAAKAINSQLRQAVTDAYNAYESLETDVAQAKNSVDYVENQIRGAKNRIEQMRSSSGDSLNVFGQRCVTMKKMVDECAQRGKFSGPVLGPIGFYCKIQPGKEDFAGIAEFALGSGILDRFVVCNDHDRKLLQQIRRKVGCQADCGILQQAQHARYKIPDPPQVEGIETLASVISVQNDLIFNCLVDNAKIDERALSRSKEESERHLLVSDGNGRNSIRGNKIKEVFFLPVGDMWKLNKGGSIQLTSNTRKFKRTIGVDMQGAIREAERELDALKEERKIRNQEFGAINAKEREAKIHWNQCKRRMQENEKTSKDSQMEIDNIKAEERNSENVDADTSAEEEEVADAQNALEEIRKSQVDLKQAIEEKKPQIKEIQDILMEITERNKKVLEDLQKAEDALSRWYSERDQQQAKLQRKREKMEQYNNIIEQHTKNIEEHEANVAEYLFVAKRLQYQYQVLEEKRKEREENGEGYEPSQTQSIIEPSEEELDSIETPTKLNEMKESVYYQARVVKAVERIEEEKENALQGSRDDFATAMDKYVRAKEVYKAKLKQIEEIESTSAHMKADMDLRKARWRQFRDYISDYSGQKFDETLNIKGSSGTIDFDHANGTLDLIVQKDSANENSQQKDVKALSGGERSFTTIALLLALGEMLETPFRVMDEFDVFLDPVTRKLIIDTLIEVGQSMPHRQFIFITPQDVSNVNSSPTLKILKMKPPERREVAGGHTQQTLEFSQE